MSPKSSIDSKFLYKENLELDEFHKANKIVKDLL